MMSAGAESGLGEVKCCYIKMDLASRDIFDMTEIVYVLILCQ